MKKDILLAAVNCDQIKEAFKRAENKSMVAFATLDDKVLSRLKGNIGVSRQTDVSVYFYESG